MIDFHSLYVLNYLMYSCMVKIGSTMPMKMVPMNAGDEKKHQRLGERHRGLQIPVQIPFGDIRDANQFPVELAAFLGHGNHFQDGAGKKIFALRQAFAEMSALLHALDGLRDRVHENLVADGTARDVQACTSGTPAPSRVPSIRQKRAMANCATSGPTIGERKINAFPDAPALFRREPGAHQRSRSQQYPPRQTSP